MKVFVWKYLDNVSYNYHTEGGLMVVAESLEEAIELAEGSGEGVVVGNEKPDFVFQVEGEATPVVVTFPDAGCC